MSHPATSPIGSGERWAVVAALCYAATNVFLRASAPVADATIAALLRLSPMWALAWSLLLVKRPAGRDDTGAPHGLSGKVLGLLIVSGVASYFVGNHAYQLALRMGGISVTIPVTQSASMGGGILLGAVFLAEHFNRRVAWGALAVAVGLLLLASAYGRQLLPEWHWAIPLAALAGLGYATANLCTRSAYRRGITHIPALTVNTSTGIAVLLGMLLLRDGLHFMDGTSAETAQTLLTAGVFNAGALYSLNRALAATTSARVNSINTGNIAVSTLLAAIVFQEALSPLMTVGIALIIGGIVSAQRHLAAATPPNPAA